MNMTRFTMTDRIIHQFLQNPKQMQMILNVMRIKNQQIFIMYIYGFTALKL